MFKKIISFSIANKLIVFLGVIGLVLVGIRSLNRLPLDAVPDITNNQVQVVTVAASAATEEMEKFVTTPLEMSFANLQGVTELRSVSRSGLSVITVVFEDDIPILEARQLVSEQLNNVGSEIRDRFGNPELMPITTGLGEIYQYALKVKPGYEKFYSPIDLRTVQDWIVKRQLAGTPGIVEVSSFGGKVKQLQVSIDPFLLRSYGLTLSQVFDALQKNNANTGGSYIEKNSRAYFIRSEGLLKSITDVEQIVVDVREGIPVTIGKIARVEEGYAPRFGAMTMNGTGEVVGGITLMMKGANSSQVIENVQERIKSISKSLPKGIYIEPYLNRSTLVSKTIGTVVKNLLEGGIIVVLVLLLLLGNLRAALIVASVIPLSMLFAITLMDLFGVSANLMSLGAIDFGLVVDGAVIIVEGVVHRLHQQHKKYSSAEIESLVESSTSRIYSSAVFGVMIIIVVFLPILTLTGTEGKMFRPMAQTLTFAISGSLILSLTYVPMMSALFLRGKVAENESFADRIMRRLSNFFGPLLEGILKKSRVAIGVAISLLVVTVFVFSSMGGEFIPTLDEGDFAIETRLAPGASLSRTMEVTNQVEKIILRDFPEAEKVVSKIGTAEVPTDPMPIEAADVMVVLKPREQWTSASNAAELAEKMKEHIDVIPGSSFEFSQPIQMRFNELMTGVKSDVAIKIFGEDMQKLAFYADSVAKLISGVDGAADIKVEQTEGLTQLVAIPSRPMLARYGLSIDEVNQAVRTAFSGESTGSYYEGERRFDLVVRFSEGFRQNPDLSSIFLTSSTGQLIPLDVLVEWKENSGPSQISREMARRRIVIGVNVRDRDVESVVNDIQNILNKNLKMDPGYYVTYGGQFENLIEARARLSFAVPVALGLILILLFFAFGNFSYALLIFSAVPFSAIGGVFLLWLRDMPFSISAGVGFIALFGIAVLNGIVLVAHFNHLKEEGESNIDQITIKGTIDRLRPVLMTASVASLGFLPMALSSSAGAEVQKPLATVVIGGLISSTLLTLFLVPVIYNWMEKRKFRLKANSKIIAIPVAFFLFTQSHAQESIDLDKAIEIAISNSSDVKIGELTLEYVSAQKASAFSVGATEVTYQRGQINSSAIDGFWQIYQNFSSPLKGIRERQLADHRTDLAYLEHEDRIREIKRVIRQIYWQMTFVKEDMLLLEKEFQLSDRASQSIALRVESGGASPTEKIYSDSRKLSIGMNLKEREVLLSQLRIELLRWLRVKDSVIFQLNTNLPLINEQFKDWTSDSSILVKRTIQEKLIAEYQLKSDKSWWFPSFGAGYFTQSLDNVNGYNGVFLGISVPLFDPSVSRVQKATKIELDIAEERLQKVVEAEISEYQQSKIAVNSLYEMHTERVNTFLPMADELEKRTILQLDQGSIDMVEFYQQISQAIELRRSVINVWYQLSEEVNQALYLLNK